MNNKIDLSIVLPCLNEEKAISKCLEQIIKTVTTNKIQTEIIIVDNGSKDKSVEIIKNFIAANSAKNSGISIRLVYENIRGYGSAYQKGLAEVQGIYIFMADLDSTYDFSDIPRFIAEIKKANDLVVGNRFIGNKINEKLGSMPWHHKYIGNPVLSGIVRLFFGIKIRDIHCGARMIRKDGLKRLNLTSCGMEFASEMIIKASKANLKITEIPISYNERVGVSKLNSFRDGWKHLRFILIYSPMVIFLIPGVSLFMIGLINITNSNLNVHQLIISAGCTIIGYQLIYFTFFAKIYGLTHLGEKNPLFEKLFKYITLERAGIIGLVFLIIGILNQIYNTGVRGSILELILLVVGVQTISSAFMLSILAIKEK